MGWLSKRPRLESLGYVGSTPFRDLEGCAADGLSFYDGTGDPSPELLRYSPSPVGRRD
jgi:hypothetical protein